MTAVAARLGDRGRRILLVVLAGANAVGLAVTMAGFFLAPVAFDWTAVYAGLGHRIGDGTLYQWESHYAYRYSPVAAYVFAALTPIGPVGWSLLHFAPLVALPRRLALLVLVSAPFWADVFFGNDVVFAFVPAALALAGSVPGTIAFFAVAVLIPRPFMLPLVAWLVWHRPSTRRVLAAVFVVHAVLALATGYAAEWLGSFARSGDDFGYLGIDVSPAVVIGGLWPLVGVPLGAWFVVRDHIGFASLAASPYWQPYYLLMVLLEAVDRPRGNAPERHVAGTAHRDPNRPGIVARCRTRATSWRWGAWASRWPASRA